MEGVNLGDFDMSMSAESREIFEKCLPPNIKFPTDFNVGGLINGLAGGLSHGDDWDEYSPFDKPINKEIQERLDNEERRETAPPRIEPVEETVLKSVYCNYRGRLTVYDVHGQKVQDLSGMITYEKYTEIERRSNPDITEFDGIEDYRRIGAELKKTVVINDESGSIDSDFDFSDFEVEPQDPFSQISQSTSPFSKPVSPVSYGASQPNPQPPPSSASAIALANAIRAKVTGL